MSRFWIWMWAGWFITSIGAFGLIEWRALTDDREDTPPLTQVIKTFVPRWLIALGLFGFLGWFYDHLTP